MFQFPLVLSLWKVWQTLESCTTIGGSPNDSSLPLQSYFQPQFQIYTKSEVRHRPHWGKRMPGWRGRSRQGGWYPYREALRSILPEWSTALGSSSILPRDGGHICTHLPALPWRGLKNGISFETAALCQSERQTGWMKVWDGWLLVKEGKATAAQPDLSGGQ